jgi:hypothetical protein
LAQGLVTLATGFPELPQKHPALCPLLWQNPRSNEKLLTRGDKRQVCKEQRLTQALNKWILRKTQELNMWDAACHVHF